MDMARRRERLSLRAMASPTSAVHKTHETHSNLGDHDDDVFAFLHMSTTGVGGIYG